MTTELKLATPVQFGSEIVETLIFRKPTGKDLRRLPARPDTSAVMDLAASLCAQTPAFFDMMDAADVVVAHQTFAWLAVARGVPCVMFAEDMPTHFRCNGKYENVRCWNDVVDLFRYPYDLLCENDIMRLLKRATMSDCGVSDWRRRMIGSPFSPTEFVEKVEKYI